MADKMQWNTESTPPTSTEPAAPTEAGTAAAVDPDAPLDAATPPRFAPYQKKRWEKRELIIALVLFAVLAPLLLVSLGALAANIMGLASLMDPVASQGATLSGKLGTIFLMVVTSAYPFVYFFSLIETFRKKDLNWKTWLVCVAALPMIGILLWLFSGSL